MGGTAARQQRGRLTLVLGITVAILSVEIVGGRWRGRSDRHRDRGRGLQIRYDLDQQVGLADPLAERRSI